MLVNCMGQDAPQKTMRTLLLEGYTADEVLGLPDAALRALVLNDEPLVFKVGSGQFKAMGDTLLVELGHVDGGGEGALPTLASLVARYAGREGLRFVEWRVHAVHCANPNLKLRRVLERRGFVVRNIPAVGDCYWQRTPVVDAAGSRKA
jgi:hypothetical protein